MSESDSDSSTVLRSERTAAFSFEFDISEYYKLELPNGIFVQTSTSNLPARLLAEGMIVQNGLFDKVATEYGIKKGKYVCRFALCASDPKILAETLTKEHYTNSIDIVKAEIKAGRASVIYGAELLGLSGLSPK